jgi:hypothetical protein
MEAARDIAAAQVRAALPKCRMETRAVKTDSSVSFDTEAGSADWQPATNCG